MPKGKDSRKKSQPDSSKRAERITPPAQPSSPLVNVAVGAGVLYLVLVFFFSPVIFQGKSLTPAADMIASAGMYRMGEEAIRSGRFPLWNPTLFCGLPMFSSLQYALFVYPPEYPIRLLSYLFGPSSYRVWFFHYWLAGIFMLLLARHKGVGWWGSILAGMAYALSPQLIVLVDVGHGSKLMAMTYLPLIWLLCERLRERATLGRAIALGAVFAVEILALHPQVAAYGALLMALLIIYYEVPPLVGRLTKRDQTTPSLPGRLKWLLYWGGAMVFSLVLSAVLWVSVLDYARYSIRGATGAVGGTGGGVSWDYATGWSFHPVESLTFLFPGLFGFANETYWGTVGTPDGTPFTHNPMYFGAIVLVLAVIAVWTAPKTHWGFPLTLAVVAWVLSFGRYLPLLYKPLYLYLPLFNKFRAPVMGQVLLLLGMALLAGVGWQAVANRVQEKVAGGKNTGKLMRVLRTGTLICGICFLTTLVIGKGGFPLYKAFAGVVKSGTSPQLLQSAWEVAFPDLVRTWGLLSLLFGLSWWALVKAQSTLLWGLGSLLLISLDILPVSRKLVNFIPSTTVQEIFREEGVVRHLKQGEGKFRLHALDNGYKPANWWSYHGVELTTGYFGAKMADFQYFMQEFSLDQNPPYSWLVIHRNPAILDLLNVRYVITSYPLEMIFEELERQGLGPPARKAQEWRLEVTGRELKPGRGPFLYRNLRELPRARLVGNFQVIPDLKETLSQMKDPNWDPQQRVILDRIPEPTPHPDFTGSAKIVSYQNERVEIEANLSAPAILVLADTYYPSGWKVMVDGQESVIMRANGVLRGVALPAGHHQVVFLFRPSRFYLGLIISLAGALVALIGSLFTLYGKKRGNRSLT